MRSRVKVMLTILGVCTLLVYGAEGRGILRKQRLRNECGLDLKNLPRFDPVRQELTYPPHYADIVFEHGEALVETLPGWFYLMPIRNLLVTTKDSAFIAAWRGDRASITMKHGSACVFELDEIGDGSSLQRWEPLIVAKPGKPAVLIVSQRRKGDMST